ncbi:hypothetical protein ACRRTK_013999 [Alexandromys fortis]
MPGCTSEVSLHREFMSNQAKAVIKTTDDCLQLQFGPSRLLPSVAVSQGASESALKWMSPHNCQGLSQRYKLQPRVIRVTAYTNGSGTAFANITAPTIALGSSLESASPHLTEVPTKVTDERSPALKQQQRKMYERGNGVSPKERTQGFTSQPEHLFPSEMMIYAGDQSRQLAVAYVTASGKLEKLEVAFQKTSI